MAKKFSEFQSFAGPFNNNQFFAGINLDEVDPALQNIIVSSDNLPGSGTATEFLSLTFEPELEAEVTIEFYGNNFNFNTTLNQGTEVLNVVFEVRVDGGARNEGTLTQINDWLNGTPFGTLPIATPSTKWNMYVNCTITGTDKTGFLLEQNFI